MKQQTQQPAPVIQLDQTRILGGLSDSTPKVAAGSKTVPPPPT